MKVVLLGAPLSAWWSHPYPVYAWFWCKEESSWTDSVIRQTVRSIAKEMLLCNFEQRQRTSSSGSYFRLIKCTKLIN